MKKSIGLDLDGTLLDSKFRHQKLLYDILMQEGYEININELNDFLPYKSQGKNTKEYLLYKYSNIKNADKIVEKWIENIEDLEYLNLDFLYNHVNNLLENLNTICDLYLVTARKNKENTLKQLNNLDITRYFKKIYIVSNSGNIALNKYKKTKNLGIDLIVGDTEIDLKWSQYLKADFFAVNYGFRDIKWWKNKNIISYNESSIGKKIEELIFKL